MLPTRAGIFLVLGPGSGGQAVRYGRRRLDRYGRCVCRAPFDDLFVKQLAQRPGQALTSGEESVDAEQGVEQPVNREQGDAGRVGCLARAERLLDGAG